MLYPKVKVKLSGKDGNAFSVLGRVIEALKKSGVNQEEINKFKKEAMSGNYEHLLQVCMDWVNVR